MIDPAVDRARGLVDSGRCEQAAAALRRVLQRSPGDAHANQVMSLALAGMGELQQAVMHARRAAEANPRADFLNGLGVLLERSGDRAGAQEAFQRAVAADGRFWPALVGLGNVLAMDDRLGEAIAAHRAALAIVPRESLARINLAGALVSSGRCEEAIGHLRGVIEDGLPVALELSARSQLCAALNYSDATGAEELLAEHAAFGRKLRQVLGPAERPVIRDPDPERALRVGFLSPDLRTHSVAFFLEPILSGRDPGRLHITCYHTSGRADDTTARLKGMSDGWREAGARDDAALAQLIRSDRIDVLVELSGHTAGHRLGVVARRPAPLLATYIGYPNTTGLDCVDLRLVDSLTDPPGAERWATERLARLDPCFLCYGARPDAPTPKPRERGEPVTFGSFNAQAKISPTCVRLWASVLRGVPGSRLVLKNNSLGDESVRSDVLSRFARHGIEPARVELLGRIPGIADHLSMYDRIDVALDSFPYHGTTTTVESLWMGVPVVTHAGRPPHDRHASRVGVSLLSAVGLSELVAEEEPAFARIAAEIGSSPSRLAELRSGLRARVAGSALCDGNRMASTFESALREAWRDLCTGGNDR